MIRALFCRGRHHIRTAPRPADGGLVTVDTIVARIRREQFEGNMRRTAQSVAIGVPA
ncbi:hypothetical protein BI023_gp38 [Mycobacterium phage Sneeze]|uniref:Uncharacterized protein n=2 Tax=Liefievirus TaxID=1623288 RepID=A0A481VT12_9CAUD|nr:hypothetical protein BI023_gp38 [Mycobacterium phage Sneeze]YP_010051255.1 hypothetical protein KDW68_gp38 [Mycobacterium phage Paito]YP_010051383.1 hypothetical protein KDW71_gp38 [Mycobacterium phage Rabbs]ANU79748.1 hypothetical protein SEA_SNEEZE_38 [Mycobacterium phage Sneeze]AYD84623.1 hypothetical protein SEA_PAITO_38 [Mycobacterium phage Paito]QBI96791.1 hypothetical protein SEA_RABBS_38 [Mycobacterium phage Rabbs]